MAYDGDGRYEISTVFSRTFDTIGANFPLFAGLSLVLSGLPALAVGVWQTSFSVQLDSMGPVDGTLNPNALFVPGMWLPIVVAGLVSLVSAIVLQAALTRATVQHLSGEKPDFVKCLTVGLSLFLPLLAISVLVGLGVGFAALLLVVPGIILWIMWVVTVPVYVQEKVGVFEAFSRSRDLTRGARWRIFLTMLIVVVALWVLAIPVGLMTAAAQSVSVTAPFVTLLSAIVTALSSMVMTTVEASIYVELREVKEGVAPADLEAIFA